MRKPSAIAHERSDQTTRLRRMLRSAAITLSALTLSVTAVAPTTPVSANSNEETCPVIPILMVCSQGDDNSQGSGTGQQQQPSGSGPLGD